MGHFPYTQICVHGHKWYSSANSWDGWSDNGLSACPKCGCTRLGRVDGHGFGRELIWDEEEIEYKGVCEHEPHTLNLN